MTKKKNYQAITDKILRDAAFISNSADDYGNPFRKIEMQAMFFRRLRYSRKFSALRIFLALVFFLIPSTFVLVLLIINLPLLNPELFPPLFLLVVIFILTFLTGLKLLILPKK